MLAIVEALKEYQNFLLGAKIIIHTDHKNLLANSSSNDRVFCWKQKIEEFGPTIQYVQGHTNIEADALSRFPLTTNQQGMEVMLNYPQVDPNHPILNSYPLDLQLLHKYQLLDGALIKAVKEDTRFKFIHLYGNQLVVHQLKNFNRQCIVVPQQLQYPAARWLHSILGHAGITRLGETLSSHFWFPHMKDMIINVVRKCNYCQKNKIHHKSYGHFPPNNLSHVQPWDEVHVDMIGPWKVVINNFEYPFRAVTCSDAIINLPEVIPV